MREDELLRTIYGFYKESPRIVKGPGDDCAVVRLVPDKDLIISTDSFVENIHFNYDMLSLREIGYKAVASALSDVAAMGGKPVAILVNLMLPETLITRIDEVYAGMYEICEKFCCSIVGGNLEKWDKLEIHVSVFGEVKRDKAIYRDSAKPGDLIAITGDLGRPNGYLIAHRKGYTKGYKWWINDMREKFAKPIPRIKEMERILSEIKVNATIDVSDGLGLDGFRMAKASYVEIVIHAHKLPINESVKYLAQKLEIKDWLIAVESGEEYEVLLSIPPQEAQRIEQLNLPITIIGEVREDKPGMFILDGDMKIDISKRGWDALSHDRKIPSS